MYNEPAENDGIHLRDLIDRTRCNKHNAPTGIPCFHIPNNVTESGYYPGACGGRIKAAGFNGKVTPYIPRERPAFKQRDGDRKPFNKNASKFVRSNTK